MEKKKLESTRKIQRLAALPHNPYARKDIESIRIKYGLDKVESWKAWAWYGDYTDGASPPSPKDWRPREMQSQVVRKDDGTIEVVDKTHRPVKSAWEYFSPYGELYQGEEYTFDTDIPIEKDIFVFMRRYQLPIRAFMDVLEYVLTGEMKSPSQQHWNKPRLRSIPEMLDKRLTLKVFIDGITSETTRKQWVELWNDKIASYFNTLKELGAIEVPPRKVGLQSMEAEMKRWSEWYQLSEIQGLGPVKALEKWEKDHPEQAEAKVFDQSTVTHAITEFREIITPIVTKD